MYLSVNEEEKLRHPYYQIAELPTDKLRIELATWTRLELIDWLCWNDRNGIYRDEEALDEVGVILDKPFAISIIVKQISEGDGRLE